jgi:hypothetical protein
MIARIAHALVEMHGNGSANIASQGLQASGVPVTRQTLARLCGGPPTVSLQVLEDLAAALSDVETEKMVVRRLMRAGLWRASGSSMLGFFPAASNRELRAWRLLGHCIGSELTHHRMAKYLAWCKQRLHLPPLRWTRDDRRAFEARLERLCGREVEKFVDRMRARRIDGARIDLAINRAIAGSLDGTGSGEVERTWQELSDSEFARYIRLGLDRETLLLKRAPDWTRADREALAAVDAAHRARRVQSQRARRRRRRR